ncbi:MAG: cation:dicarboxylase symporter family transporter [Gemmatimonadaceae bacterium]|nr:cation:dicarboxylase symporter family transporter [Gemmatimonadaceae bacterium]
MESPNRKLASITLQCVVALVLGVLVAQLAPEATAASTPIGSVLRTLTRGWGNLFRMMAVPLTACLMFGAVLSSDTSSRRFGRISTTIPPVFVLLMLPGFVLAYLGMPPLLASVWLRDLSMIGAAEGSAAKAAGGASYSWIDDVIPPNFFSAIAADNVLGVIVVALIAAFALRQTAAPIARIAAAANIAVEAMFVVAGWLLRISPLIVFAAVVPLAADSAAKLGGVLLAYVLLEYVFVLALTVIMLLVAMLAYAGSPLHLLRAIAPAQLAALTTRSSLSTLPLIIRAAERDLGVSPDIAGYVASAAGALLKVSRSVTSPVRLLLLGFVLAIPIGLPAYIAFCLTILVLSTSTSGIPKAVSGERSMSAFVAVGIPPGPYSLLASLTWATDPLLTLVNSTSYLTATLAVARLLPSTVSATISTPADVSQPTLGTGLA